MFTLAKNSLGFEVKDKTYGLQDRGISPKGASDQLSFNIAKTLLGEPKNFRCFEIIFTSKIYFDKDCVFTLTGAHYKKMYLHDKGEKLLLEHSCVYKAKKGNFISIYQLQKGFRLYLMSSEEKISLKNEGLRRGEFSKYFSKSPSYIRLIKGPEFHYLKNSNDFFANPFKISMDSNLMGLRLISAKIQASKYDIISSSVDDGTVQLTQNGAIALLRHRQTTGGYPRIFSVIQADIDTLSQYPLGSYVHFKLIKMSEAKELLLYKENELRNFKQSVLKI